MTIKTVSRTVAVCAAAMFAAVAANMLSQPAAAGIRCQGNFQVTKHGLHAAPYCQDNYLAQVAREAGMRVSNEAIRRNPGIKEKACRLVGYDIRVKDTCANYLPDRDLRRF